MDSVSVVFEADDVELEALAQFVKRLCWVDIRTCAVDDVEAQTMVRVLDKLRASLAKQGFSPR